MNPDDDEALNAPQTQENLAESPPPTSFTQYQLEVPSPKLGVGPDGERLKYLVPYFVHDGPAPKILKEVVRDGEKILQPLDIPFAWPKRQLMFIKVIGGVAQIGIAHHPPTYIDEIEGVARGDLIEIRVQGADIRDFRTWSNLGFIASSSQIQEWVDFFASVVDAGLVPKFLATSHKGWLTIPGEKGTAYIYGDRVLAPPNVNLIAVTPSGTIDSGNDAISTEGSLEAWAQVISLALSNPAVAVLLGFAVSAPMLSRINGMEPGVVNLVGKSGSGKTTMLQVAASMIGSPGKPGKQGAVIGTWRTTDNAAESTFAARSDCLALKDEVHQAPGNTDWMSMLYMGANGQGKARMSKGIEGRAPLAWTVQLLSSGEESLESKVANQVKGNKVFPGGLKFRIIDLNVAEVGLWGDVAMQAKLPNGGRYARLIKEYGITGPVTEAVIVESIERAVLANHGHFWPILIRWLQDPYNVKVTQERFDKKRAFLEAYCDKSTSTIVRRRGKHVAAALVGLETMLDLLGINDSDIQADAYSWATGTFWKSGLDEHEGDEQAEMVQRFEAHVLSDPSRIMGHGSRDSFKGVWGWRLDDGSVFLPTTTGIRTIASDLGLDPKRLASALLASGWTSQQRRQPGVGRSARAQRGLLSKPEFLEPCVLEEGFGPTKADASTVVVNPSGGIGLAILPEGWGA